MALDSRTWQTAGERQRLTTGTTEEDSPSVSKDGSRLVFASLTGNHALYQLPLDANRGKPTGDPQRLTGNAADDFARSISFDGKRIAFISNRTGSEEVWVSDLETAQERELTTGGKDKWFPIITPDGELVAWKVNTIADPIIYATPFIGSAQLLNSVPIVVLRLLGRPIVNGCSTNRARMAWHTHHYWMFPAAKAESYLRDAQLGLQVSSISNDGHWIAFSAFRTGQDFEMYVAPFSAEKAPHPVCRWISIPHSPKAHPNARWSPSGNMLYFSSEQDGHACLWAVRLDPTSKQPSGERLLSNTFTLPRYPWRRRRLLSRLFLHRIKPFLA